MAKARTRARGLQTGFLPGRFVADQDRCGAIDNPRRIAGMMDVINEFHFGVGLNRHRIETAQFTHLHKGGLQRGQRLHGRLRPHVLVLRQNGQPIDVLHRHDRAGKAALVPCHGGALLALDRIGVDVIAGKSIFGGDQIGGNALRQKVMRHRDRRIDRPGAAGRADADPAHRFDAAADGQFLLPGHDLRRGEVHGIETRGAEPVDLHAGYAVAKAGDQRRGARDIGGRLADRIDHAENDVIEQSGIEVIATLDGAKRLARKIERGHFVQRAVDLAAAARRAHVIVNEGFGHEFLSKLRSRRKTHSTNS